MLDVHAEIRDNLHGSIALSVLENLVISHAAVQRLRRIRQTSFLYLAFPGATHSRFEHSLGVLHLATVTWRKLYDNQKQLAKTLAALPDYREIEKNNSCRLLPPLEVMDKIFHSPYIAQALRLAALMHDVGHPPFSHSGERLLPQVADIIAQNPDLPPYLQEFLQLRLAQQAEVDHEVFTVLLADKILEEIYVEHGHVHPRVHPQDVASIICADIPPQAGSEVDQHGINVLGRELLSSDLDIDRMDYLLRDSRECGVSYGVFDFARILDSLALYHDDADDKMHLCLKFSGLAACEDYLQARILMHTQIYFHKSPVAAEAMLQNLVRKIKYVLPANLERFMRIDEYNILAELEKISSPEAMVVLDDLFYKRKLWKRIFEVTSADSDRHHLIDSVRAIVSETQEEFEYMSYLRNIIRMPVAGESALKIIKKNRRQVPQLEPIEKHSRFYQHQQTIELHRFYVTNHPRHISCPQLKEKVLRSIQP